MPPRKAKPAPEQAPLFELGHPEAPRSAIDPDMPMAIDDTILPVAEIPEPEPVPEPQPVPEAKPELTPVEKTLQQFLGLKALLGTFGRMNVGENYRDQFEVNPGLVRTEFRRRGIDTTEKQAESEDTAVTLEEVGRSQVSDMLGLKAVVKAKAITKEQAEAVRNATYDHYAGQFNGIPNKKARASLLGKVNRRIKKLEAAK